MTDPTPFEMPTPPPGANPPQRFAFATADELARAVAAAWLEEIEAANRQAQPRYGVALSGGRIARRLFQSAVAQAKVREISMRRVHFFWADERCVPPDDAKSNYRLARELLLSPLAIQSEQIHRIRGEDPPPAAAARAELELRRAVPSANTGQPVLDLVLLGMGEDGHVASLFPGEAEALMQNQAAYRPVRNSPKPPPNRITLGYAAIAAARKVWVLASGAGKENALRDSLTGSGPTPLARVLKLRRQTKIFTDITLDQSNSQNEFPIGQGRCRPE